MRNENRIYFVISFFIHFSVLAFLALKFSQPAYIKLPIELQFYSPKGTQVPAEIPEKKEFSAFEKKKKKEEIPSRLKKKKQDKDTVKIKSKESEKAEKTESKVNDSAMPQSKEQPEGAQAEQMSQGSAITLENKNFPYTYYTNMIVKKISRNWSWSNKFGRLKALVYFRIGRSGEINDLQIKKSSGDSVFDEQALRSISLASPFSPLPSGYGEDNLGVFFEFFYTE